MSRITRRDFINGSLLAAGASMLPFGCTSDALLASLDSPYYPPALIGLRGSHPGSNEHAHSRAWDKKTDWGRTTKLNEAYDLIVVGGGISGLSAAYFYQQEHGRDKKVLILDNHDDFGGHARRNEHMINGDLRLTNGGSQTIQSPHARSALVLNLLKEIGIDLDRFKTAYDVNFYKRNKLGTVTYFNKQTFGEDKVVKHPYNNFPWWVEGLPRPEISIEDAVHQAPLSSTGKEQLLRVLHGGLHELKVPREELVEYIYSHSYFDYLKTTLGVDDPGVLEMARTSCSDWAGGGADVLSIGEAIDCGALGFDTVAAWKELNGEEAFQKEVEKYGNTFAQADPYIHHFPDGNATIARMLVKRMIPKVGAGENAEEIVLSKFNYAELDKPSNVVRLRLNSTVVNVRHGGDPSSSSDVFVNYINDNELYQVNGKGVVMACYNAMVPHIVSDLPKEQDAALRRSVKIPLQYTTVGLKNWRAIKEIEMGMAMSPGNMHQVVMMDFPVSIGGYEYTKTPDDPCIIQMIACPFGAIAGTPPIEQFREVRHKMLTLQFADYENEIRAHLSGMLPKGLFEFDRDVESIIVNRWAHGYVYSGSRLYDSDLRELAKIGRQPFGRITIANIDSAPSSYAHAAIKQAWRAVKELG
ncbi:MAG: FAD-dependent oxidoreductase [Cyclobacteriaceae bacterium]|nr:FAD-dependent oxidoreductase [Cyclobacteriaceae bacterium]